MHKNQKTHIVACWILCLIFIGHTILSPLHTFASTWSPTVFVNTEAFQVIDEGNSTTDVEVRFGSTLNERLYFDRVGSRFRFTDDLYVEGTLSASGAVAFDAATTINANTTVRGTISGQLITQNGAGSNYFMGNLGIGTTIPTANFHVSAGNALALADNSETLVTRFKDNFVDGGNSNFLDLMTRAYTTRDSVWHSSAFRLQASIDNDASAQSWIEFRRASATTDNTIAFGEGSGDAGEWMQINNGNVGIGTVAPETKLDVAGTISGANLTFMGVTSSSILGSLGIGKSGTPNTKLEIVGTASGINMYATKSVSGTHLYASDSFGGAGLSNCTGTSNKLTWLSATKKFSCETDQTGGGGAPDTGIFIDTGPAAFADNNTTELFNDATKPNIVTDTTSSTVLASVHMRGTVSNTANDAFLAARIVYTTNGSDPSCSTSTQLGEPMIGGFTTATTHPWQVSGTFLHNPGVAGTIKYTVCTSAEATGTATDTAEDVRVSLAELGG